MQSGSTPYKSSKLVAAHFGGTRNPLIVRWPAKIRPDPTPRAQFLHCIDVVPTIYDVLGIAPPAVVNGIPQDSFDGTSFAGTFNDAKAGEVRHTQYFEIMGSRGIYQDGWFAGAFARVSPGFRACPRASSMKRARSPGLPTRPDGSSTISRKTGPRPTTSPTSCPRS